jgi:hypothetical protein
VSETPNEYGSDRCRFRLRNPDVGWPYFISLPGRYWAKQL